MFLSLPTFRFLSSFLLPFSLCSPLFSISTNRCYSFLISPYLSLLFLALSFIFSFSLSLYRSLYLSLCIPICALSRLTPVCYLSLPMPFIPSSVPPDRQTAAVHCPAVWAPSISARGTRWAGPTLRPVNTKCWPLQSIFLPTHDNFSPSPLRKFRRGYHGNARPSQCVCIQDGGTFLSA